MPLLKAIAEALPLNEAGKTSLGHTLLHVAGLPLDERSVDMRSEAVYKSIHETRNLSEVDHYFRDRHEKSQIDNYSEARVILNIEDLVGFQERVCSSGAACSSQTSTTDSLTEQIVMVQYLFRYNVADVSQQDVHGNTALHYLASHIPVNNQLIEPLRLQPGGARAWNILRNRYGFTHKTSYLQMSHSRKSPKVSLPVIRTTQDMRRTFSNKSSCIKLF